MKKEKFMKKLIKENRKRPCSECPWLKGAKLEPDGTIGMSSPLVYILARSRKISGSLVIPVIIMQEKPLQ
jgi:hypothetical protein